MNETMNVAVYGSLKQGFYNHRLLVGERFVACGRVEGFQMFSMGSFPMIVPGDGSIQVEAYEVTESAFCRLDRLEGYPSFYDRQQVPVTLADGSELLCWIYYGRPEQVAGCGRVSSGVWVERF